MQTVVDMASFFTARRAPAVTLLLTAISTLTNPAWPQATFASRHLETVTVQRADDSEITAYIEQGEPSSQQPILLVLQGSICESVAPGGGDRAAFRPPRGMARLDIEKYAITLLNHGSPEIPCPREYLLHNSIDQRVLDVLTVAAWLRNHARWWNRRLYFLGTSEGATVASMAGPLIPETSGIVLVNGSVGRPFREGWADAMASIIAREGGDSAAQSKARSDVSATWERARGNPTPDVEAFGNGNTLKWWNSIMDLRPSNLLLLIDVPILLMQSDHDEMTPVASARAVAEQFRSAGKENLTYVELAGLTHKLRTIDGVPAWEPVLARIRSWLETADASLSIR
jgi:pimeloyl-ACP methyl ester carboxylesterase